MRFLFILLAMSFSAGMLRANIDFLTTIRDVYYQGTDQQLGAITISLESDAFSESNGGPVSEENPVYIRIRLQQNVVLSQTIVDPTGTFTVLNSGAYADVPIDLLVTTLGSGPDIAADMPESAVQLIRGVQGESDIWLRITWPSNRWLDQDGDGVGDTPPSRERPTRFTFAADRGLGDEGNALSESGFDFSGRNDVDTHADFGADTPLVETLFLVDFNPEGCGVLQPLQLSSFDPTFWNTGIIPGAPGSPEVAPVTPFDPTLCNSPGVDTLGFVQLPLVTSGDIFIARTKPEESLGGTLRAPETVEVGETFEVYHELFGGVDALRIVWDFGDDKLVTDVNRVTYAFDKPGDYEVTSMVSNGGGASFESGATIKVLSSEESNDVQNLTTTVTGKNEVFLSWDSATPTNTSIDNYQIYRIADETRSYLGLTRATTFTVRNLQEDQNHQLEVVPVYAGGAVGNASRVVIFVPQNQDPFPYKTRFPHVTQREEWWTGIVVVNTTDQTIPVSLVGMGADGQEKAVSTTFQTLGGGEKRIGLVSDFFEPEVLREISWIELRSAIELVAFELFGQGTDNMSGISVDNRPTLQGKLPIASEDDTQFAALAFLNTSSTQTASITFSVYSSGEITQTKTREIAPNAKLAASLSDLFDSEPTAVSTILWKSNIPVVGFELWGDIVNWEYMNGVASFSSGYVQSVLPILDPSSKIVLHNAAPISSRVRLTARKATGEHVKSLSIFLAPNQRLQTNTDLMIGRGFTGIILVQSTKPGFVFSELVRSQENGGLLSEAVPGVHDFGSRLTIPHIARFDQWTTEIMLVNGSDEAVEFRITPKTAGGESLEPVNKKMVPFGMLAVKARDLVSNVNNENRPTHMDVQVLTPGGRIGGHMLYYTNPGYGHIMGGMSIKPMD